MDGKSTNFAVSTANLTTGSLNLSDMKKLIKKYFDELAETISRQSSMSTFNMTVKEQQVRR